MGNFLKPNPGIACVCDSKNNLRGRIYFKDESQRFSLKPRKTSREQKQSVLIPLFLPTEESFSSHLAFNFAADLFLMSFVKKQITLLRAR